MAEITLPIEVLARLPPRVLRQIAEVAERRAQGPEPRPDFSECVKALFTRERLPLGPPPDGEKQAEWRRAFVAAVGECYERWIMGQQRALAAGVAGALVATTRRGTPRRR